LDEQDDVGSGVGPADADVVEAAAVAQGDGAGFADGVGADAVVGVGGPVAGDGFGPGGIRGGGGGPVRQGAVRAAGVVAGDEGVQEGLELGQVSRLGCLGGQPFLQGLLEPFDLALGLGVVGLPVLLLDPAAA
jgi:hypothetical protein